MPRYAPNKMPVEVKSAILSKSGGLVGCGGGRASRGVLELWIAVVHRRWRGELPRDAFGPRYLSHDDRIEIVDGVRRGDAVKLIAARIGKSYQTVYRELARNRKSDGRYQPWSAHNRAYQRRRRTKLLRFAADAGLREVVAAKLGKRWSPAQISRWLRRHYRRRRDWHVCTETIYEAVYRGLIVPISRQSLRTGRIYRRRRGRGRTRDGALKQSTP